MMAAMQIARVDGRTVEANTSGRRGECPACAAEVVARVGEINIPHWAHLAGGNDCDPWAEGESSWHAWWKTAAPLERREVVIGVHRADVVAPDGTVCELQHSHIDPAEITEREVFYGDMRWIFDAHDKEFTIEDRGRGVAVFRKFHWPTIATCKRRVMLDLGEEAGVLSCEKINDTGSYMWGHLYRRHQVRMWLAGPEHPELWHGGASEDSDGSLRRRLLATVDSLDGHASLGELCELAPFYGLQEISDELAVMISEGLVVETERFSYSRRPIPGVA